MPFLRKTKVKVVKNKDIATAIIESEDNGEITLKKKINKIIKLTENPSKESLILIFLLLLTMQYNEKKTDRMIVS